LTPAERLEELKYLRIAVCFTMSCVGGAETGENILALAEIEEMCEGFLNGYGHLVSPEDREALQQNPEHLVTLIDRAIRHYRLAAEAS